MMDKFSKINRFRNTYRGVIRHSGEHSVPTLDYIGTVKLHGTNAGVRREQNGDLIPQSRNRILSLDSDNYGFAKFVDENSDAINEIFDKMSPKAVSTSITLYGEWVGTGIQGNVAVAQLEPHWVLFNAKFNGNYDPTYYPIPIELQNNDVGIYNIFQIPYYKVSINFQAPDIVLHEINELTNKVEESCPWGKFRGVDGVGEGIVWVPCELPNISDLWFKTKGAKHSGSSHKVRGIKAKISVEKANSIAECLEIVLPDMRLQQGVSYLKENYYDMDHTSMGAFLKWVSQDVLKEEIDTIEENGLEWKDMHKPINTRARNYFLDYLNNNVDV